MMYKKSLLVWLWGALLFIPFLGSVHLFDWDEINFAESAREMLVTGDFFRVQINFQPFWEKPPLFFWLQAACMKLFGVNEFAARFPNALVGIATLAVVYHIGKKYFSNLQAWLWVLFITGSFTPHLYFKSGIIDPLFNLFIFLSLYQLFLYYTHQLLLKHILLAALFCGLAILTKGPVALLVILLCAGVYSIIMRFSIFPKWPHILIGICIISAITSVWFMNELLQNGTKVLRDFIVYQAELFTQPVAGHGQPWYYHLVVLFFGAFPASVFCIKGFVAKPDSNTSDHQKTFRLFMSILFFTVLILFSIVKTKIVHYSSLCYLPLTFIASQYATQKINTAGKNGFFVNLLLLMVGSVIALLVTAIPFIDHIKSDLIPHIKDDFAIASLSVNGGWQGWEFCIGLVLASVLYVSVMLATRANILWSYLSLLIAFSLCIPLLLAVYAPRIEEYSQKPAIEFYEELAHQDCYVETLGFKSYAQYYYTQCVPPTDRRYTDKYWLASGQADKPAYFVVKVNELHEYDALKLTEVKRKGGFVLLTKEKSNPTQP